MPRIMRLARFEVGDRDEMVLPIVEPDLFGIPSRETCAKALRRRRSIARSTPGSAHTRCNKRALRQARVDPSRRQDRGGSHPSDRESSTHRACLQRTASLRASVSRCVWYPPFSETVVIFPKPLLTLVRLLRPALVRSSDVSNKAHAVTSMFRTKPQAIRPCETSRAV